MSETQREHNGEVDTPVVIKPRVEVEAMGEQWLSSNIFVLSGLV